MSEQTTIAFSQTVKLELLRDRILLDLKLGKQAPGYKAVQKALNRFITELTYPNTSVFSLQYLAMCWAVNTGEWLHQHQPIKIKKHGRKSKSVFRYGLDYLRSLVTDLDLKYDEFLLSLQFLSCT